MQGRPNAIVVKMWEIVNEETKERKEFERIIVQTPMPRFNCLALEGGGVACAGHAGAIQVMDQYGVLDDFEFVSGISGGALAALVVCLGYTAEESAGILSTIPMDKFMERSESWSHTPSLFSSIRKFFAVYYSPYFALSSGKVFLAWVQQLVKGKMGDENATFADLVRKIEEEKAANGSTRKKKLFIGGTDLSLGIPEVKVLSAETAPDMPLAYAAVISALYPFVFSPFQYKGHTWGDGGIKSVLLTKIFDDERFLPDGIQFTKKAVNPGVLAIKVDTRDEINQILWGIHKEVKINTTSDYAWQVANGATHNNDISEIREARNTIALADADVDRLDLYVSRDKTERMVEEAKATSKEFFENYINAAYQSTRYESVKEWIETLSLEKVIELRNIYKGMLKELQASPQEVEARAKLTEFDPSKPTVKQLEDYIAFLKDYIQFSLKKHKRSDAEIHYPDPGHHINIPPEMPKSAWHNKLKVELEETLDKLQKKIEFAEKNYAALMKSLADCMQTLMQIDKENKDAEPFHGYNDEKVQVIASYYEYLNRLREERDSIECKLWIKPNHHAAPDIDNSKSYAYLNEELTALRNASDISAALRAVIIPEPPVFKFETKDLYDIKISMDLRKHEDRKLYLIAAMFYLERKKCADRKRFEEIFRAYFSEEQSLPESAEDLMHLLNQGDPDLQLSMFRLERLLHFFEKNEVPTAKPVMNLGVIFGLSNASFFARPKSEQNQEIEMRLVFNGSEREPDDTLLPKVIANNN